ncbi:MAG: PAS domain S-box protein [Rhodospirillaceae bacterium]|nr:PAS domain S-box protein [Rhodospirillaceae bacterium]
MLWKTEIVRSETEQIVYHHVPMARISRAFSNNIAESTLSIRRWLDTGRAEFKTEFSTSWTQIDKDLTRLTRNLMFVDDTGERAAWSKFKGGLERLRDDQARIITSAARPGGALMKDTKTRADVLIKFLAGHQDFDGRRSGGMVRKHYDAAHESENKLKRNLDTLVHLEWVLMIGGIAIAGLIAYLTARSILPHIQAITDALTNLANGDETISLRTTGLPNEIGKMAQAFAVLKNNKAAARQLSNQIATIAKNLPGVVYRRIHHIDGSVSIVLANSDRSVYVDRVSSTNNVGEFVFDPEKFMELLHPDDRNLWKDRMKNAMISTEAASYEMRFIEPNGGIKWRKTLERPHRQENGDVAWDGVALDITDLKNVEQALRESEARFQAIVKTAITGIITIDQLGIIETVNPAAENIFGFDKAELVGQNVSLLMPSPDRERHDHYLANYLRTGDGKIIGSGRELVGQRKNGETFPMDLSVSEPYWSGRRMFTGIVSDISERKLLEERLRQAQKMEALGNLAGGIAHDFNNALFPIITITEVVIDDLPESSNARKNLEKVVLAAKRGGKLVRQILTYSRGQPVTLDPVHLPDVVDEAISLLRATLPATTKIHTQYADGMGYVLANATQIHEVIINLGANAAHAIGDETGRIKIEVNPVENSDKIQFSSLGLKPGPHIQIKMSDTGHGMDEETAAKIFDPYFTTKRTNEGNGLGLAAVQGIIATHNGAIHVASAPNQGAVFSIYLPLWREKSHCTL